MSRYLIDRIAALPNVTVHTRTQIESLDGDGRTLAAVHCKTPDGPLTLDVRHLFLFTGADPNTAWLRDCNVNTDAQGIRADGAGCPWRPRDGSTSLETSVPGVFAIGDVRSASTKRVAAAVGEGAAVVCADSRPAGRAAGTGVQGRRVGTGRGGVTGWNVGRAANAKREFNPAVRRTARRRRAAVQPHDGLHDRQVPGRSIP